jgi:hypothetical protein
MRLPNGVFVASNDQNEALWFKSPLQGANVSVVEPNITNTHPSQKIVPPFLVDFFVLTLCHKIWMVLSFSLFAVMAT